ncbi:MAG: TetR/AcrR family transcriptional regulator [Proteobacteria bacterium]|nr:TetR/AcrR family transcriptional regulator [Pseudomonadota bacterium]MBU1686548.1 TetR/AcrR family transcriptional regulator [Pseudomonadota bacterium]
MEKYICEPSHTFLNLPEEKRLRIIREAVCEFGEYGYQRASVNRIVQRLGIAKGSLYQYFTNKEALFIAAFDHFSELVKKTVRSDRDPKGDFFYQVSGVLHSGYLFLKKYPDFFLLYSRVLAEEDTPHREMLIKRFHLFSVEYFRPFLDSGKASGLIRTDVNNALIFFMVEALLDRFFRECRGGSVSGMFGNDNPDDSLTQIIDQLVGVLRVGLGTTRI